MKLYTFILLSIYLTLLGCGQPGALYMPSKPVPVKTGSNPDTHSTPNKHNATE